MTLANNYAPVTLAANGVTTQFSGPWQMISAAYAEVVLENTSTGVQTPVTQGVGPTQYQIALSDSGVVVTFNTAPASGNNVIMSRNTTPDQTNPYSTSRGFQGTTEEDSFDKLTAVVQENLDKLSRAVVAPAGDNATNLTLPIPTLRASMFLAFDASGNVVVVAGTSGGVTVSPAMAPVVGATTLALARTAMGVAGLADNNTYTGTNNFQAGTTTVPTVAATDNSNNAASTAMVQAAIATGVGSIGGKNKLINGDCRVDQHNGGGNVTPSSVGYASDRWQFPPSQASKIQIGQNLGAVTPPVGFSHYIGAKTTTAFTPGTTDTFPMYQGIEGNNVSDLAWGTANAKAVTLSFWVYSSLTGQHGGVLFNTGIARAYPFAYTVISANTWEKKSITIPGDTSGTWDLTDNQLGVGLVFDLGSGATKRGTAGAWASSAYQGTTGDVQIVSTLNAVWYATGIQLEVGSTATNFDYRQFGTELSLCQRYYFDPAFAGSSPAVGYFSNGSSGLSSCGGIVSFPALMRVAPTIVLRNQAFTNASALVTDIVSVSGFDTSATITTTNSYVTRFNFTASAEL